MRNRAASRSECSALSRLMATTRPTFVSQAFQTSCLLRERADDFARAKSRAGSEIKPKDFTADVEGILAFAERSAVCRRPLGFRRQLLRELRPDMKVWWTRPGSNR